MVEIEPATLAGSGAIEATLTLAALGEAASGVMLWLPMIGTERWEEGPESGL